MLYDFAIPNMYVNTPDNNIPNDKKYLRLTRSAINPEKNIAIAYANRKDESKMPRSWEASASVPSTIENRQLFQ